jgi:hypothetical protein
VRALPFDFKQVLLLLFTAGSKCHDSFVPFDVHSSAQMCSNK